MGPAQNSLRRSALVPAQEEKAASVERAAYTGTSSMVAVWKSFPTLPCSKFFIASVISSLHDNVSVIYRGYWMPTDWKQIGCRDWAHVCLLRDDQDTNHST